jgi:hypothetical protein
MRARVILAALLVCCASAAHAADRGTLAVSAVVLSKSNCRITSGNALTLAFGTIDPASTSDATVTTTASVRCTGSATLATFSFQADNGLFPLGSGKRRMQHGTVATEFLPYSLAITPTSASIAKGDTQLITITGTITPPQFQDALAGGYSDRVAITLSP